MGILKANIGKWTLIVFITGIVIGVSLYALIGYILS